MKNVIQKNVLNIVAKAVYITAEKEANSACMFFSYQPKVPKHLKKQKVK